MSYSFTNCDNFSFEVVAIGYGGSLSRVSRFFGNPVAGCVKYNYYDIKITDYYIYTKEVYKFDGATNTTETYYSTVSYGFMLEIYK